jgi:hypothetical protein
MDLSALKKRILGKLSFEAMLVALLIAIRSAGGSYGRTIF